jgi:hypothetical protein
MAGIVQRRIEAQQCQPSGPLHLCATSSQPLVESCIHLCTYRQVTASSPASEWPGSSPSFASRLASFIFTSSWSFRRLGILTDNIFCPMELPLLLSSPHHAPSTLRTTGSRRSPSSSISLQTHRAMAKPMSKPTRSTDRLSKRLVKNIQTSCQSPRVRVFEVGCWLRNM